MQIAFFIYCCLSVVVGVMIIGIIIIKCLDYKDEKSKKSDE